MSGRRTFTREFKAEAVRLATQGAESQSEVARRLGIDVGSLRKWKRVTKAGSESANSRLPRTMPPRRQITGPAAARR